MSAQDIREKVKELIRALVSASQTRNIYGRDHNLAKEAGDMFYSVLTGALSDRHELTIGVIADEIAFEKEPFYEISANITGFIERLKSLDIEKVSFLKGIEREEVSGLLDLLSGAKNSIENTGHMIIGAIGLAQGEEDIGPEIDARMAANKSFGEGVDFLKNTLEGIKNNKPVDVRTGRFVVGKIVDNLLKNMHAFLLLTSLKQHDEYTFVHSLNVSIFTVVQAEALGLPQGALTDIGVAALLHDSGKLAVEADIIRKGGKLNPDELDKMRSHPLDGAEILLDTPDMPFLAAVATFEHHIKYDMQGYPALLYGGKLNLASMMVAIADVYDALRSKRSYHDPFPSEKVYEEMTGLAGKHFHPGLLEIFFQKVGVYPPGTLVELDNGAVGLVVKGSIVDMRRPQVEILYEEHGEEVKEPYMVNLLSKDRSTGQYRWTITKSIPLGGKHKLPDKYEGAR